MNLLDRKLYLIFALGFLFSLITFTIQFYFPVLYVELGFDPIQIGSIIALSFLIQFILPAPIGILCDRKDIRFIVLLSILLWLFFFWGMLNTTNVILITGLIILFRAANLISKTGLNNIILKIKEPSSTAFHESIHNGLIGKSQNEQIGYYMFFSYFGVVFGMLVGGFVLSNFGFNNLFMIMTIFMLILIPFSFFLPKIKPHKTKLEHYAGDLFDKRSVVIFIVVFLYALHFGAEHISYSLFLKDNLGLDFMGMGYFMATAIFFMAFAAVFGGRITNKSNIFLIFGLSLFISGSGHILMTQGDVLFSLLFRIIHEIGDALQVVTFLILLKEIFPKKRIGGDASIFVVAASLGAIIGSYMFSLIGFEYGHHYSLIISGALTILGSVIFLSFYKHIKKV